MCDTGRHLLQSALWGGGSWGHLFGFLPSGSQLSAEVLLVVLLQLPLTHVSAASP